MQDLKTQILSYVATDESEVIDRELILRCFDTFEDVLTRENPICHLTASCWVVNRDWTKALMLFHNLQRMWMWPGGHADGDADLGRVAERELLEETSLASARLLDDGIFSLEVFAVSSHVRRGEFVSAHLHLNCGYIFEADEAESFKVKPDENSSIRWMTFDEIGDAVRRGEVGEHYRKLINKTLI